MSVPRLCARGLASVVLASIALIAWPVGPAVGAAAVSPTVDSLAGPFVDVAVLAGPSDAVRGAAPPRLLALRAPDATAPGIVHLVMLGSESGRWTVIALADFETDLAQAGPGWLIPLGDGFALVSVDGAAHRTFVTLITTGPASIAGGRAVQLDLGVGGAGAADVDGDGIPELVLSGRSSVLEPGNCMGTSLQVLDGRSLVARGMERLAGLDLDGAAIGRLGGRGQDLIAYARTPCVATPSPGGEPVVLVNLASGASRMVLPAGPSPGDVTGAAGSAGPSVADAGPSIPLLVDTNADGVAEAIVRQAGRVLVLDPSHDWRAERLDVNVVPLAVTRGLDGSAVIALYRPGASARNPFVDLVAIGRTGAGRLTHRVLSALDLGPGTTSLTLPAVELATDPGAPPPAWVGDLAGTGCLDVVLPQATFRRCPGNTRSWEPRRGPAWLITAPLVAYDSAGGRRLLVAGGLGWSTESGSLAVPAPLAATNPSATWRRATAESAPATWRSGPSSPFVLEELDAGDIGYFETYPSPVVDVDPNVSDRDAPGMIVGGTGGDRVFIRLMPRGPTEPGAIPTTAPRSKPDDPLAGSRYLVTPPAPGYGRVAFVPVPPASTAGANPGFTWVSLPEPGDPAANAPRDDSGNPGDPAAGPQLAAAWRVEALGVNGYGEASEVSVGTVALDRAGPNAAVDAPFLSAPWPFSAPIRGTTEPGARVRLAGGSLVDVAANGAFELRAQLAPWPQDLVIEAIDAHGNLSSQTLTVIGGVDYRRLPWQALVMSVILLGAAITTWRGPAALRRGQTAPETAGAHRIGSSKVVNDATARSSQGVWPASSSETAEIEDLPPHPSPRS